MSMPVDTPQARGEALARHGFNLDLMPARLIPEDFQTDSLLHQTVVQPATGDELDDDVDGRLSRAFSDLFGLPFMLPVAQGRLAEAILVSALVSAGDCVASSAPFPTLEAHLQRQGATVSVVPCAVEGVGRLAGDLDVMQLEQIIRRAGRSRVPFLLVEACCNATGGQPLSLQNLKAIREVADRHGIPLILDATRIISNACLIREHAGQGHPADAMAVVGQMCGLADGLLMSATKELPTTIGGFLALRDRTLFERCVGQALVFGAGVDKLAKRRMLAALAHPHALVAGVVQRIAQVRRFQALLGDAEGVIAGAHGVFLRGTLAFAGLAQCQHPERALLNHLYVQYGIRGAINPGGSAEQGDALIRFALPTGGKSERSITFAAGCIRAALAQADRLVGLEEVHRPAGVSGALLASFRPEGSVPL